MGKPVKKLKNETALVKEALRIGEIYAKNRKVGQFEATDSSKDKVQYLYRLLVHDGLLQPLPKGTETDPNMRHKLAIWISKKLPDNHPLK